MSIESPQRARARLAALSRFAASDSPRLADARRDLQAANLKATILQVTTGDYPLSPAQRDELVRTLWTSGVSADTGVAA